jgi:hypothetical protein
MNIQDTTIYLGPGQGLTINSNETMLRCRVEQVGFSLLRNFTSFEYPPMLTIDGEGITIKDNLFVLR